MSTIIERVPLILCETRAEVEAELRDCIEDSNLVDWQTKWKPIIDKNRERQRATHGPVAAASHWDWREKMENIRGLLSESSFCIECEGVT
jgi:hypothetical protein